MNNLPPGCTDDDYDPIEPTWGQPDNEDDSDGGLYDDE